MAFIQIMGQKELIQDLNILKVTKVMIWIKLIILINIKAYFIQCDLI